MSTTYDWSPVFNAINGIAGNYVQRQQLKDQQQQYGSLLDTMFGRQTMPDLPAMQASAQLPAMQLPGVTAQAQNPALKGQTIGGGPITLDPGSIDVSTPAIAGGQTTFTGPLGQMYGDQKSAALLPILRAMGPQMGGGSYGGQRGLEGQGGTDGLGGLGGISGLTMGGGLPLLLQTAKNLMQPAEFDQTPRYDQKGNAYLVGKDGSTKFLNGVQAQPDIALADNGMAYDKHGTAPGTVFNDPNKNFGIGANGQVVPNKPAQKFAMDEITARNAPEYARMAQDNFTVPTMVGYSGPDGEEQQVAATYNKKTGTYYNVGTGQAIQSPQNFRILGNATGGARSQAAISRIFTSAEDATSGIENLSGINSGGSGGLFPNLETTPLSALSRTVTPQEVQDVQATMAGLGRAMGGLATGGLAVDQTTQKSYEGLALNTGDTYLTKMRKLAEMRQQSTNALDVQSVNPILSNDQRKKAADLSARIKRAVPWDVSDVQRLENSQNDGLSLHDLSMQKLGQTGQNNGPPAPRGVDPQIWQHMTPQERSLWTK